MVWGNCSTASRDKIKSVQIKKCSQVQVTGVAKATAEAGDAAKEESVIVDDEEGEDDEESEDYDPEYEAWSEVQMNKDLLSLVTRIHMTHKGTCSGIEEFDRYNLEQAYLTIKMEANELLADYK